MIAASLFSGIGAPETAMPEWQWAWCAEIERFPSAVMAVRHPATINLGDVTAHDFAARAAAIARPDVLVFGSPCQDFSVGTPLVFSSKDYGADAGEIAPTLRAMGHDGSHANAGGQLAIAVRSRQATPKARPSTKGSPQNLALGSAVRRLTPLECERLQGFPDGYTAITYRGKPAADGPRYKALSNSMAVPIMRWILSRIAIVAGMPQKPKS